MIHHLNASGLRERGHSSFKGGVDTQLMIKPDETVRAQFVLYSDKQKDASDFQLPLKAHSVTLPEIDPNTGQPVTSLVIVPLSDADAQATSTARRKSVLQALANEPDLSRTALVKKVGLRKADGLKLVKEMEAQGELMLRRQDRWVRADGLPESPQMQALRTKDQGVETVPQSGSNG